MTMNNDWFVVLGRMIVAIVLLAAGLFKVTQPQRFRKTLNASKMLSTPIIAIVAVGVPAFELLLPPWLIFSRDPTAAWITVALLTAFTTFIVTLRTLGREVPCGCFSGTGTVSDPFVARNLGLICLVSAGLAPSWTILLFLVGAALLWFNVRQVSHVAALKARPHG